MDGTEIVAEEEIEAVTEAVIEGKKLSIQNRPIFNYPTFFFLVVGIVVEIAAVIEAVIEAVTVVVIVVAIEVAIVAVTEGILFSQYLN